MVSVYAFTQYKKYLKEVILKSTARGVQSRLSRGAGCHPTYLSQVLAGHAHLTPEHAIGIAQELEMSDEERDYFLNMVQAERSGTEALRKHHVKKMDVIREMQFAISKRVENADARDTLDPIFSSTYYSDWSFSAIHLLAHIPAYQSRTEIVKRTGWAKKRVDEILEFLVRAGLLVMKNGLFKPTNKRLHLNFEAHDVVLHHANLRLVALLAAQRRVAEDLQYSSTISLSREDFHKIKDRLLETIVEIKKEIKQSADENLYCFNVDLIAPFGH